jgi:hypothetical protein
MDALRYECAYGRRQRAEGIELRADCRIYQKQNFMVECHTVWQAFLALLIAVVIVEILLPRFNEITGKHLTMSFDAQVILSFLDMAAVTGVLSGSYPALCLSRFNPVTILIRASSESRLGICSGTKAIRSSMLQG